MPHTQARFGILPLARLRGRRDGTGNPFLPHKSPGREPGDCGNEGHPAIHTATRTGPNAIPMNGPFHGRV